MRCAQRDPTGQLRVRGTSSRQRFIYLLFLYFFNKRGRSNSQDGELLSKTGINEAEISGLRAAEIPARGRMLPSAVRAAPSRVCRLSLIHI